MDLSQIHHPVSDLFPRLDSIDPADYMLSADQLRQFEQDGFVSGIRLLEPQAIEQLRSELAELVCEGHEGASLWYEYHSNESPDPNQVLFHALGAWRIRNGFHDLLWNPAFVVPASQLLGGDVRFWHDQLFCKPAKHGGVVAWHQDYSYWTRTAPMAHLTCWMGLDPATTENGCLEYIPGSHRWDLLPITGLADDMDAIAKVLTPDQLAALANPVQIELQAGEAAFHHPLLVHGSRENRTEIPRRAVVLNVVRDGVASQSDEPLLQGVDIVPAGETLSGQFFPLLYSPGA